MNQRTASRGVAMGTLLICLSVVVLLLFVAVSGSLSHLNLVNSVGAQDQATNLAESAIAKCIEQIIELEAQPSGQIRVQFAGLDDAEGIVTFNRAELPRAYSTYNLNSDSSVVGAGGLNLPPESVHIVARGRVGAVTRWVECVYHKPPYPDGLVASGPVEATGLVLTGVKKGKSYTGVPPSEIPAEDRTFSNLFSNASGLPGNEPSILLGPDCEIEGSVGSPGRIKIDPNNTILGEVLPGAERRTMPSIDVANRISELGPNAIDLNSFYGADLTLNPNWFCHSNSSLEVGGNLDLNGSALTVSGDLLVRGALKGVGVILVDGSVTIEDGGSAVETTDLVAIGATGDVDISAGAAEDNFFQGLVYSEGDFEAKNITVIGTVVANGKNGKEGSVNLENVNFVRSARTVDILFSDWKSHRLKKGRNGRAIALSFTLTEADDGSGYIADVKVVFSIDSGAGKGKLKDKPLEWGERIIDGKTYGKDIGDDPRDRVWASYKLGHPGPNFGKDLGLEIADWAGKQKSKIVDYVHSELTELVNADLQRHELTFSLNNLLAEDFGSSRILLWRKFQP